MKRNAHIRVAELATNHLPDPWATPIAALWEGIETGATLPDEFVAYWDTDDQVGVISKVRMHRCYMDSDDPRDRGCVIQIVRYATAIPGFVEDFASGDLEGSYDDEEFALNLGMFFGIASHHIADMHTPVHVCSHVDPATVGARSSAGFHTRIETDLDRAAAAVETIQPYRPQTVALEHPAIEALAQAAFDDFVPRLPLVYGPKATLDSRVEAMTECVRRAAQATADVWSAVLNTLSPQAAVALARLA